jgi:hypothetical protein
MTVTFEQIRAAVNAPCQFGQQKPLFLMASGLVL